MPQRIIDWSKPQHCNDCSRRLRPQHTPEHRIPGSVIHNADNLCRACYLKMIRQKAQKVVTVADLAKAGHPCISPAPMPSNKKSSPW